MKKRSLVLVVFAATILAGCFGPALPKLPAPLPFCRHGQPPPPCAHWTRP